jgi:hypothetical protein
MYKYVGRCTSGVYTQLVPVQSGECSFDYILVIDTEGLRAPNQSVNTELNHDNMLATFIIGLADIAIVNVYHLAKCLNVCYIFLVC